MRILSSGAATYCPFHSAIFLSPEEQAALFYGQPLGEVAYFNILFSFLHRPPNLDYLQLSLAEVNALEEDVARELLERLQEAREITVHGGEKMSSESPPEVF